MTDRVFLRHDVTGGTTHVPNLPDVLNDFASRGWLPVAEPGLVPYIPRPDGSGGLDLDPAAYEPSESVPDSASDDEPQATENTEE